MDIRQIINEEIADYIKKLDTQKKQVQQAVDSYEQEDDDELSKIKKGMAAENEKQKLYRLEAEFLKEKIAESKDKQQELRAKMNVAKQKSMT